LGKVRVVGGERDGQRNEVCGVMGRAVRIARG